MQAPQHIQWRQKYLTNFKNIMKNAYFILILLIGTTTIFAQKKGQTPKVSTYKILRDNTNTNFITGNLELVNLTISGSRMSIAGGPGIKAYFNGVYATADYEYHYLDGLSEALNSDANTGHSVYNNQKSRNADANIGYFFKKTVEKKVAMNLYSQSNGSTITHYYTNVDAHVNKIFGVMLGYKSGFSNIMLKEGFLVKPYGNDNVATTSSSYNTATNMQYGWITIGPSFGSIEDVVADIEGYGLRKSQYLRRFYFNLIYAAKTKVEDVYFEIEPTSSVGTNKTLVYRYVIDGNTPMSKLGFNLGMETFKFAKFGLSSKLEVGSAPGVKGNFLGNLYFSFKVGLSLGKCF